ncbi:uncharacterized protein LOC121752889 [Salvia splendens]|uniref:uncharacterized protein LOC121752889 n=1 Tax=Salvia splendens TaxID=180675 RepID=UPI001C280650|nr:uncharacterized protein LOC121752889 [Salvia splendens]
MPYNILIWNARGVANKSTQSTIKYLIKTHRISVLAIIEPLIKPKPDVFSRMFGLQYKGANENGQIWIFAENGTEMDEWDSSEQVLHARFLTDGLPAPFFLSVVYGKCSREARLPLWEKLRALAVKCESLPWMVGRDFNIFTSEDERQGASLRKSRTREMSDFVNAISDCQLMDLGADGVKFTWARGDTFERLDRALIATRSSYPATVQISKHVDKTSFFLEGSGEKATGAQGMVNLHLKLGRVKKCLKWWNKNVFGNIFERVKKADMEAQEALKRFEQDQSPCNRTEMNRTAAELVLRLKMEEDYWKQKAAIRWSVEGERNTKFFQGWVKQKRAKSRIHSIEEEGQVISEDGDLRASAVNFFQSLLSSDIEHLQEPELDILSSLPTDFNLEALERTPTIEEVKRVVFDINADSASGPDGFSSLFYQTCWDLVGTDVTNAVIDFFHGAPMPRGFAATMIILIPKKKNPTLWSEFRPISLCNVSNKIISKLLTMSMAPLLPMLTAPNQSGFIKGRLLSDNVLLAKEMFHELGNCNPSPNMALKLDMAKAYDRVQWPFLLKVLRKMGFTEKWVGMIERCINSCWFSVLLNGTSAGFFKSTRGLRQGDPLSPSLFILAADYLSRVLDRLILGQKQMRFNTARYTMGVSHLSYADDIIIFTQARRASLRKLRGCLKHYEEVSGQKINEGKSCFYIDNKHVGWADGITAEKISQKIHCWCHKHLSFGGRLTLIKSILEAILVHVFQVLEPTKGALRMLEQVLARYFWGSCNTSKKTHWIRWKDVCRPTLEGGLGLRRMADIVEAYSYKLWWRFRERSSLWAEYMHKKYWSVSSNMIIYRTSRFSPIWRRMFKAGLKCQALIRWMLGNGKVSFWNDIWLKDQPISELCFREGTPTFVRVEELWTEAGWNTEEVFKVLDEWGIPREMGDEILVTPFDDSMEDRARWALTPHGNFTVASAWEQIRSKGDKFEVYDFIWGKGINPTISVFLWRLLANRISVDVKLQWRGVSLASKCRCCERSGEESRLHLFVSGKAAREIWNHFSKWFPDVPEYGRRGGSIERRMRWWQRHLNSRNKHHICILIPCLIFWYIWTERNGCVHLENVFKHENVCKRVVLHLSNLVLAGHLKPDDWKGCAPRVEFMTERANERSRRRVERVQWRPPDHPWLKLNTDGAFGGLEGKAGGGGILRNHLGETVQAFCTPISANSGFEAEVKTMLEAIAIAKNYSSKLWIETDAERLYWCLEKNSLGPADLRHSFSKIYIELKEVQWKVTCIRRKGNKVADFLASMGKNCHSLMRFEEGSFPARARALARLDQIGMPSFRFEALVNDVAANGEGTEAVAKGYNNNNEAPLAPENSSAGSSSSNTYSDTSPDCTNTVVLDTKAKP